MSRHKYFRRKSFDYFEGIEPLDLSPATVKTLNKYGSWLEALADGVIHPETPAQERFVSVAKGTCEPESEYEIAWRQYASERAYQEAMFVEACSTGISDWPDVIDAYAKAAKLGSDCAQGWLNDDREKRVREYQKSNLNEPDQYKAQTSDWGGPSEEAMDYASEDYSDKFDDFDGEYFEDIFGGPDDSEIESRIMSEGDEL